MFPVIKAQSRREVEPSATLDARDLMVKTEFQVETTAVNLSKPMPHADDPEATQLINNMPNKTQRRLHRVMPYELRQSLRLPQYAGILFGGSVNPNRDPSVGLYDGIDWETKKVEPEIYVGATGVTDKKQALGTTREAIRITLLDKDWRLKQIAYGNGAALCEDFMSNLLAIHGYEKNIPKTIMVLASGVFENAERKDFRGNDADRQYVCIASEWDGDFLDLGNFLRSEGASLVEGEDKQQKYSEKANVTARIEATIKAAIIDHVKRHPDPSEDMLETTSDPKEPIRLKEKFRDNLSLVLTPHEKALAMLETKPRVEVLNEQEKTLKRISHHINKAYYQDASEQFHMLPDTLLDSFDQVYLLTMLVGGNWDVFNERLMNFGFTKPNMQNWVAKFVDPGNLGPWGHDGGLKEDSADAIKWPNKQHHPFKPLGMLQDYELAFGQDFAKRHKDGLPKSMNSVSASARSIHYGMLVDDLIQTETDARSDRLGVDGQGQHRANLWAGGADGRLTAPLPLLELGFRMRCMTPKIYERFCDRHWLLDRHPAFMRSNLPEKHQKLPEKEEMYKDLVRHREQIITTLGRQIEQWAELYPERAKELRAEVRSGVASRLAKKLPSSTQSAGGMSLSLSGGAALRTFLPHHASIMASSALKTSLSGRKRPFSETVNERLVRLRKE